MFETEIREAEQVFAERVSAAVRAKEDFLMDAFAEFVERRQQEIGS